MISVIVPVYNVEKYIEKCICSIVNQTYSQWELILVNDGSTDNSYSICQEYAQKDKRIKLFDKENGGVSSARNFGLEKAIGDYIIFVDGDDFLELTLFEDFSNLNEENKLDLFMFEYSVDYPNDVQIHSVYDDCYGHISTKDALEYTINPYNRLIGLKIYSKDIIGNNRFDTTITLGEDTLFSMYAVSCAKSIYYSDKFYYHYVQSDNSAVRSPFNRKKLSGVTAYQGVVDLCERLGYKDVAMVSRKSLANLAVSIAKKILSTPSYKEKSDDLNLLKQVILKCKKELGNNSCLDKKTKIKLILVTINIKLLKFI